MFCTRTNNCFIFQCNLFSHNTLDTVPVDLRHQDLTFAFAETIANDSTLKVKKK
jgi:hypothetical protein